MVSIRAVSKSFHDNAVIDNISFDVAEGEHLILLYWPKRKW